eukprot:Rhum_TRINITY_DN11999_c0_g1::Rhum_TRINITY_DN11999_c0_g1_i1::g.48418::m.48418/K08582/CAPN15; calpain-15
MGRYDYNPSPVKAPHHVVVQHASGHAQQHAAGPNASPPQRRVRTRRLARPLRLVRPATYWPAELGRKVAAQLPDGVPLGLPPPEIAGEWDSMTEDGRLYKLQVRAGRAQTEVYFYNATRATVFHIDYEFSRESEMRAGDQGRVAAQGQRFSCRLTPGRTVFFAHGTLKGCKLTLGQSAVTLRSSDVSDPQRRMLDEQAERELRDAERVVARSGGSGRASTSAAAAKAAAGACLRQRVPFVDASFPPAAASLGFDDGGRVSWMRFGSWLHTPALRGACAAFTAAAAGAVQPNDVDPGCLGDSWLVSALAIAAEEPDLLRRVFMATREEAALRGVGAHTVRLCVHGWWQEVVVDDYVPATAQEPLFARSVEDPTCMWAALVQKAFAKVRGGYGAIRVGDTMEALADLTGCPALRFDLSSPAAFSDAQRGVAEGADVLAFLHTPAHADRRRHEGVGLLTGHSYALLDAVSVPVEGGTAEVRLVRVRNPWGDAALWTGRWSPGDALWQRYPEVREAARGGEGGGDGSFWMDLETAQTYFDSGAALFAVSGGWHEVRVAAEFRGGQPLQMLEVWPREAAECFVSLHQRADTVGGYLPCVLTVVAPEGEQGWVVKPQAQSYGGKYCRGRSVTLRLSFAGPHASRRPYYIVWRTNTGEDCRVVASLHCESRFATLAVKRPDARVLQPLRYSPVWQKGNAAASFDPSTAPAATAAFQLNRHTTVNAQVLHMSQMQPAASPQSS